jgi:putative oxidoreductase
MRETVMISKLSALIARVYGFLISLESVPILLVRIVLGVMFIQSGHGKLFGGHEKVTGYFTELGIPLPDLNAWLVACTEFLGGIGLLAGLGTRIFALMLSITMLVATLTARLPDLRKEATFNITDLFFVPEVLAMLLLLWMVFSGPGKLSLDNLVAKGFAPPPPRKPSPDLIAALPGSSRPEAESSAVPSSTNLPTGVEDRSPRSHPD